MIPHKPFAKKSTPFSGHSASSTNYAQKRSTSFHSRKKQVLGGGFSFARDQRANGNSQNDMNMFNNALYQQYNAAQKQFSSKLQTGRFRGRNRSEPNPEHPETTEEGRDPDHSAPEWNYGSSNISEYDLDFKEEEKSERDERFEEQSAPHGGRPAAVYDAAPRKGHAVSAAPPGPAPPAEATAPLSPMAALLSISTTLPKFERQVLKEMLIDERLGKGRSIYEFKEEEPGPGCNSSRSTGGAVPSISSSPLGFSLCEALRTFSTTGNQDLFKNQLYLLAVQKGMDVGSTFWINVFAPFTNQMCNKVSLNGRRERLEGLFAAVGSTHGPGVRTQLEDAQKIDPELAYGSSNFFAFSSLLERAEIQDGDCFLDLGSGCGRAVIAAAILHGHKFKSCYGVELLEPLHRISLGCERRFNILRSSGPHDRYDFGHSDIGFLQGDVRAKETEWGPNTPYVVFIGAACFGKDTMAHIEQRLLERLPLHGRVISMTRQLFKNNRFHDGVDGSDGKPMFKQAGTVMVRMSWGHTRCFVYKRVE